MHKIQIKNFGPIKDFKADIKDCFVFIGPQGSGKSTISKAIYFFKSLKKVNFLTNSSSTSKR